MSSLKDTKAGDEVYLFGAGSGFSRSTVPDIKIVARTTATRIVIDADSYLRRNGRQIGASSHYYSSWIKPATDESKARWAVEIEQERMRLRCAKASRHLCVTAENVDRVEALIEEQTRPPSLHAGALT